MAGEKVYVDAARIMLESKEIDALIVGIVPLTAALKTVPEEFSAPDSLTQLLPELARGTDKPIIVVVDSGPMYDPYAEAIRLAGIPILRSADQAVRSLGRYLCHRASGAR